MKRNALIFVSIIIFISACSQFSSKETPTINREKMAHIAADLHIIESHIQNSQAKKRDSIRSVLYHQFYKIHEIDSIKLYDNQMIYYQNPKDIEEMYGRVLEILEEREKTWLSDEK